MMSEASPWRGWSRRAPAAPGDRALPRGSIERRRVCAGGVDGGERPVKEVRRRGCGCKRALQKPPFPSAVLCGEALAGHFSYFNLLLFFSENSFPGCCLRRCYLSRFLEGIEFRESLRGNQINQYQLSDIHLYA